MGDGVEFRVARFRVRVFPTFLLVAAFLGWGYSVQGLVWVAAWIAVAFVAVLIHELGHAFMFRHFGTEATIVLEGFGGLTSGRSLPLGQDLLVDLAGPATGIAIGGPIRVYLGSGAALSPKAALLLQMAEFAFFWWSVFNLLPILPLDGGRATVALASMATRRDQTRSVRVVSIAACAVGAVWTYVGFGHDMYIAGLFMILAAVNLVALVKRVPWTVTVPDAAPRERRRRPPAPRDVAAGPPAWGGHGLPAGRQGTSPDPPSAHGHHHQGQSSPGPGSPNLAGPQREHVGVTGAEAEHPAGFAGPPAQPPRPGHAGDHRDWPSVPPPAPPAFDPPGVGGHPQPIARPGSAGPPARPHPPPAGPPPAGAVPAPTRHPGVRAPDGPSQTSWLRQRRRSSATNPNWRSSPWVVSGRSTSIPASANTLTGSRLGRGSRGATFRGPHR